MANPAVMAPIDPKRSLVNYHGKSGKTVLFKKLAAKNTRQVVQFCRANPAVTIMQAIERVVDWSLS